MADSSTTIPLLVDDREATTFICRFLRGYADPALRIEEPLAGYCSHLAEESSEDLHDKLVVRSNHHWLLPIPRHQARCGIMAKAELADCRWT